MWRQVSAGGGESNTANPMLLYHLTSKSFGPFGTDTACPCPPCCTRCPGLASRHAGSDPPTWCHSSSSKCHGHACVHPSTRLHTYKERWGHWRVITIEWRTVAWFVGCCCIPYRFIWPPQFASAVWHSCGAICICQVVSNIYTPIRVLVCPALQLCCFPCFASCLCLCPL